MRTSSMLTPSRADLLEQLGERPGRSGIATVTAHQVDRRAAVLAGDRGRARTRRRQDGLDASRSPAVERARSAPSRSLLAVAQQPAEASPAFALTICRHSSRVAAPRSG